MQFREALDIYNRQLLKIIFVTVLVFLPIHLFVFAWIVFLQQAAELEFLHYFIACSYIFLIIIVMPPYIAIAKSDMNEDEISYKQLFSKFLNPFGFLLISTILLFLIAVSGFFLLFIPTLFALGLLALLPLYFNDHDSISEIVRNAWNGLKSNALDLVIFMVFAISVNLLLWYGLATGVSYFETNLLTYMILRAIINLIVLPYLFILFTISFHPENRKKTKWLVY